jgi:excisionase family DNA binding protein
MTAPRRWISVKICAADILGISLKGCYDLIGQGKIPVARIGRLIRVDLRALEADLEAQVQGRPPAGRGKCGR